DSRPASVADPAGTPVLFRRMIASVKGRKRVSGVELTDRTHIDCDAIAVSGGWNPIVNLLCHRGDKPRWNSAIAGFVPGVRNGGFVAAGSAAGKMLLSECLADGA